VVVGDVVVVDVVEEVVVGAVVEVVVLGGDVVVLELEGDVVVGDVVGVPPLWPGPDLPAAASGDTVSSMIPVTTGTSTRRGRAKTRRTRRAPVIFCPLPSGSPRADGCRPLKPSDGRPPPTPASTGAAVSSRQCEDNARRVKGGELRPRGRRPRGVPGGFPDGSSGS